MTLNNLAAAAARLATKSIPNLPCDAEGPVFREPWEAQAFALTVSLQERGIFTWSEWATELGSAIEVAQAAGDADAGGTYYHHWLAALEEILVKKGLADRAAMVHFQEAWRSAAERTPHGLPIVLENCP